MAAPPLRGLGGLKIVYCIPGLYNSAGMERVVIQKANWLQSNGYEVTIVTSDQMGRKPFFALNEGIKTYDLSINYEATNGKNILVKTLGYLQKTRQHKCRLQRLLDELQPDVVISTGGVDASAVAATRGRWRLVQEIHFSRFKHLEYGRRGIWALADKVMSRKSAKLASRFDKMVVLTHEDAGYWQGLQNLEAIPNPRTFTSDRVAPLDAKVAVAVGRYNYQKGFDRLIEAWAIASKKHPDWMLRIVGQGEEEENLRSQARALGVEDKIEFATNRPNMVEVYLGASIFVLSSRYEGLPMVMLEAQEYGLPMVAFDCKCGPKDLIDDGDNGLLVPNGDIKGLAAALERLMADASLRKAMGRKARERSGEFDEDKIMKMWVKILETPAP